MILVKILKRKDASSVIVAVILAMIIGQALSLLSGDLAANISGLNKEAEHFAYSPPGSDAKQLYIFPTVSALVQIVFLEILARVVVLGSSAFRSSPKKK